MYIRFYEHLKGFRSNIKLQNAMTKYKLENFIYIIFEYCDSKDLLTQEQFYFDTLKPEFNILDVAGNSLGFKHSDESKALMAEANSGENHPMFGKIHSAGTKAKMSVAKVGESHHMFGKLLPAETKTKISITKGTAIYVYDIDGLLVDSFSSVRNTAEFFDCHHQTIMRYVNKDKLLKNKWKLTTILINK